MVAPLSLFYLLSFAISAVFSFPFTHGEVSQCDNLSVDWEGGTGPFQLNIIPVFGTPLNVSIPASAFSNGKGSFSTQLPIPEGKRVVLAMSDSTGFATGGITQVLTVAPSKGGTCDSSDPGVDFSFEANFALQQCRPFPIEGYSQAVLPVTIWMVIPGGTAVVVQPPGASRSYSWIANVAAGTDMIFMMADSRGRQGGASDIRTVGASDDSSCLNDRSPSSTTSRPTTTSGSSAASHTQAASATASDSPSPAVTSEAASGVPISAIAGTVIGSLLFLAVIVTLGLFFLKNLKKKSEKNSDFEFKESRRPQSDGTFFDRRGHNSYGPYYATEGSHYPYSPNSAAPLDNPFADTREIGHPTPADSTSQFPYYQNDPFQRPYYPPSPQVVPRPQDPFNPGESQQLPSAVSGATAPPPETTPSEAGRSESRETSTTQQKAGMAGIASYKPTRFIVHTDAEDELPPPNDDGVVELPPQYTERRRQPSRTLSVMNPSPPSPTYPNASPSNLP